MVEITALEKRQARKGLEGSNPSLSARVPRSAERIADMGMSARGFERRNEWRRVSRGRGIFQ